MQKGQLPPLQNNTYFSCTDENLRGETLALTFDILIHIDFDSYCFCHSLFILCPIVYFHWARGANARARTTRRGKIAPSSLILPSLLGFPSRALPFLTLSSLFGFTYTFGFAEHRGSRDQESGGLSASLRETRRKPKGIGGMRACEFPPVPLGCHPRTVEEQEVFVLQKVYWV